MPLTVIPFAVNFMIGAGIWISNCPTNLKIIYTAMVVAKFLIFFIAAFFIDADFLKQACLVICAGFNILLIIFGIQKSIPFMAIGSGALLILLIVWSLVTVFDIHIKGGKKQ